MNMKTYANIHFWRPTRMAVCIHIHIYALSTILVHQKCFRPQFAQRVYKEKNDALVDKD